MKIKVLIAAALAAVLASQTVFAAGFAAEGEMKTVIANPAYNVNPWNALTITGVAQSGNLKLYTSEGIIDLPIDYPLYRINDYYCDKIVCKDGVWGIERNVAVKFFTGKENWELYKKQSFQNSNSVIFRCDKDFDTLITSGICSHFELLTYEKQRTNKYDGISPDEDGSGILMRFMNVRNVKTVDELKDYLSKANIRFYYPAPYSSFTPFADEYQKKLNSITRTDSIGYSDAMFNGFTTEKTYVPNSSFFETASSASEDMNIFLSCVKNVEIYNAGSEKYYISGVKKEKDGFTLYAESSNGKKYSAEIKYEDYDFLSEKLSEIKFEGSGNTVIKMQVNLNGVKAFSKDLTVKYPIKDICKKSASPVVPSVVYASKGTSLDFNNGIIYGNEKTKDKIEIYSENGKQLSKDGIYVSDGTDMRVYAAVNGKNKVYFDIKCTDKKAENKTVLFLGDSIINQNYYSDFFVSMYDKGTMKTVGTLGKKEALHEGRGGWSGLNYCTDTTKYGMTNPFLNNGKFDFAYYIKNQKIENLDAVVINLGINDLNTVGHNSYDEIFDYFDWITDSIHSYNKDIQIIFNAPEILFRSEETNTAANTRLAFAQQLFKHYENAENITVSPAYLNLNGKDDFKYVEAKPNEDNSSSAMTVSDTTHPNVSGYKSLAKGTYDVLNYIYR